MTPSWKRLALRPLGVLVAGVALAVLALPSLLDSPAGTALGLVAVGIAAALCWPLVTCVRRR